MSATGDLVAVEQTAKQGMDERFPGFAEANWNLEAYARFAGRLSYPFSIMLLGPALCGKTRWAVAAADILGLPLVRLGLGKFQNMHIGRNLGQEVAEGMRNAGRDDPLVLLDDLECVLFERDGMSMLWEVVRLLEGQAEYLAPEDRMPRRLDTSRVTWVLASREVCAEIPLPLLCRVSCCSRFGGPG